MQIELSTDIEGVAVVHLSGFRDARGQFREIFRKEWFPQRRWDVVQSNCSQSAAGVVRGLHYHFHQVDYWYVPNGRLQAALADLRPSSPTYKATLTVEMGEENDLGLFIPVGVAHGFAALTDVTMVYIVDNYYDGGDEWGVRWNDPDLNVAWAVTNPALSARDQQNLPLADIPPAHLPA